MASEVTYKVSVIENDGVKVPCPNCYIQGYPCSGCRHEIEQPFLPVELREPVELEVTWVTSSEMDAVFPHLDFTKIRPGDRVVGTDTVHGDEKNMCANCYSYNWPCGNHHYKCDHARYFERDEHCEKMARKWIRECQIVHYDQIKEVGLSYPATYEEFVNRTFSEHQQKLAEAWKKLEQE